MNSEYDPKENVRLWKAPPFPPCEDLELFIVSEGKIPQIQTLVFMQKFQFKIINRKIKTPELESHKLILIFL